jgi:type VI secretion system protein ImpH
MRIPQWRPPTGLIGRVLDAPHRFEFVQALRIVELWLRRAGVPHGRALIDHVRIKQSVSLSFPASQIEALTLGPDPTDAIKTSTPAIEQNRPPRVYITPTFMGLLGVHGVLPHHYSEVISAYMHANKNEGPRAFLDTFATPALTLFYQAWSKYRVHYRVGKDGKDGFLPLQLAIAGAAPGLRSFNSSGSSTMVCDEAAAFYAAVLRHRAVSHSALAGVLGEYFDVPILLEQFLGQWDYLPLTERCVLGLANRTLGRNAMLGTREWRRDLTVGLRIGPLAMADYQRFLPNGDGTRALMTILSLFPVPGLQFKVHLVQHASAIRQARLTAQRHAASLGLGQGLFLVADASIERVGMTYRLHQ